MAPFADQAVVELRSMTGECITRFIYPCECHILILRREIQTDFIAAPFQLLLGKRVLKNEDCLRDLCREGYHPPFRMIGKCHPTLVLNVVLMPKDFCVAITIWAEALDTVDRYETQLASDEPVWSLVIEWANMHRMPVAAVGLFLSDGRRVVYEKTPFQLGWTVHAVTAHVALFAHPIKEEYAEQEGSDVE